MKQIHARSHERAVARRGGPLARTLLAALLLPFATGCLRHWLKDDGYASANRTPADRTAALHYYDTAVSHTGPPYDTGVELEIPDGPPPLTISNPEGEELWFMTLHEALKIAMENSGIIRQLAGDNLVLETRGLAGTAFDPAIAETRVLEELGRFDASLILNLFWGTEERQLNSTITPSGNQAATTGIIFSQDTFSGRAAGLSGSGDVLTLTKPLATGGRVSAGFNAEYTFPKFPGVENNRLHIAAYETTFFTSLQQPLLAGAGVDANRAPIVIARLRSDQTLWAFKQELAGMVRDVVQAYWRLVRAQKTIEATKEAIGFNLKVVAELEHRVEQGPESRLALAQARVQLSRLQKQLKFDMAGDFAAQRGVALLGRERQLRLLLGLPPSDGRRIVAVDDPRMAPVQYDWNGIRAEALTYNPEIQARKLAIAEQRETVLLARNGLQPRVDVFIRKDFTGLGSELDNALHQLEHAGFGSTTAGVQAQINLPYRRESAVMERATHQLAQAKELLRSKAREVEGTLSLNLGQLDLRMEAYLKAMHARGAAEEYRDLTLLQFEEGKFTTRDILEAIDRYREEANDELDQVIEYQVAIANLELTKGTIFRYHGIHVHEEPWSTAAYPQATAQEAARQRAIDCPDLIDRNVREREKVRMYEPHEGDGDHAAHELPPQPLEAAPEVLPPPSPVIEVYPSEIPLELNNPPAPAEPSPAAREPERQELQAES